MKNFIMLFVVILALTYVYGFTQPYKEKEYPKITTSLSKKLTFEKLASNQLELILPIIRDRWTWSERPNSTDNCPRFKYANVKRLIDLINRYPSSTAALTAKLVYAGILSDFANPNQNFDGGQKIYFDLSLNYPKSWQGLVSRVMYNWFILSSFDSTIGEQNRISIIEDSLRELYFTEKNVQSVDYLLYNTDYTRRPRTFCSVNLASLLITIYYNYGEIGECIFLCKNLIDNFPNFSNISNWQFMLNNANKKASNFKKYGKSYLRKAKFQRLNLKRRNSYNNFFQNK